MGKDFKNSLNSINNSLLIKLDYDVKVVWLTREEEERMGMYYYNFGLVKNAIPEWFDEETKTVNAVVFLDRILYYYYYYFIFSACLRDPFFITETLQNEKINIPYVYVPDTGCVLKINKKIINSSALFKNECETFFISPTFNKNDKIHFQLKLNDFEFDFLQKKTLIPVLVYSNKCAVF